MFHIEIRFQIVKKINRNKNDGDVQAHISGGNCHYTKKQNISEVAYIFSSLLSRNKIEKFATNTNLILTLFTV